MRKHGPTVLSLFTGAGGLDEGFRAAGYRIACCLELEEWACETLRSNHPETPVMGPPLHSGNIKDVSKKDILDFAGIKSGEIDLIVGGPPCQPFSQAATQRFLKGDERFKRQGFDDPVKGILLGYFVNLVKEIKPKAFLLENVPGLMTVDDGFQLSAVLKTLRGIGYKVTEPKTIDAVEFGVPQYRKRLFVYGSNIAKTVSFPQSTHGDRQGLFCRPYNFVAHALAGMPQTLMNHVPRDHNDASVSRYRNLCFGKREQLGRVDRLDPAAPSKTVIAGGMHGGGRSHLHPFIARTLTVRECARLQTFDDEYRFCGSIARQFTQVGNAVPPLLAEHIARHIMGQVFGLEISESIKHGSYLAHRKSVAELTEQLLEESISQRPEWIYLSHARELAGNVNRNLKSCLLRRQRGTTIVQPPNEACLALSPGD